MATIASLVQDVLDKLDIKNLKPSDCQLLQHDGKASRPVDISQPLRFANIPKNAKLELVTGREQKLGIEEHSVPAAPLASTGQSAPACQEGRSSSRQQDAPPISELPSVQTSTTEDGHPSVPIFGFRVYVFTKQAELEEAARVSLSTDIVDDSFYDFTQADYQRLQASSANQKAKEAKATLMTKAMREAEAKRKAETAGNVTIRAQLQGRADKTYVMQVSLPATSPLSVLKDLMTRALEPGNGFYMYTTPPKKILDDNSAALYNLGLHPGARVHVGAISGHEGLTLRPEVLALEGSLPQRAPKEEDKDEKRSTGVVANVQGTLGALGREVPKWMKRSTK